MRGAIDGYAIDLLRFVAGSYGAACIESAWQEFVFDKGSRFDADDPHHELFFSWLFHCWVPRPQRDGRIDDPALYGRSPTGAYLRRDSRHLNPLLQRYLAACLEAPLGFYEIIECRPTLGYRARNVSTGRQIEVSEGLASTTLNVGDIIFARIAFVDGVYLTDSIAPLAFPAEFRKHFTQGLEPGCLGGSERELRRLYFDLLEAYLCERLPEVRSGHRGVVERRTLCERRPTRRRR